MNEYNERWTREKFIEYRKLKRCGYSHDMLIEHFGEDIYHSGLYNKRGNSLPNILIYGKFMNEIKITPEEVDYSFTKLKTKNIENIKKFENIKLNEEDIHNENKFDEIDEEEGGFFDEESDEIIKKIKKEETWSDGNRFYSFDKKTIVDELKCRNCGNKTFNVYGIPTQYTTAAKCSKCGMYYIVHSG